MAKRALSLILFFIFLIQFTVPSGYAQNLSSFFAPTLANFPVLKYMSLNPANSGNYFNFLMDKGGNIPSVSAYSAEAKKLINYFFLGITLPGDAFWVNLQPDQGDRLTSPELAKTDLGRVLLEQDLKLKKDMANYLSPRNPIGKEYWDKLYRQLNAHYGPKEFTKLSVTTNNRVWIVPEKAVVVETEDGALVAEARLKVLLEAEYFKSNQSLDEIQNVSEQLMKEIIIPAITKDVNESMGYAPLRQIYHSLILAQWYKKRVNMLTRSPVNSYINSGKIAGLESGSFWSKDVIYQDYLKSYTKGEYKFIDETIFNLKRMYFSGGVVINLEAGSSPIEIIPEEYFKAGMEEYFRSYNLALVAWYSYAQAAGRLMDGDERLEIIMAEERERVVPARIKDEGEFLRQLITEEDKEKRLAIARELDLDLRPIESGLLDPAYVAYAMKVKSTVNPLNKLKTGIYKGAGVDISDWLLSTNIPVADFSAYYGFMSVEYLERLKSFNLDAFLSTLEGNDRKDFFLAYKKSKYIAGYSSGDFLEDIEDSIVFLAMELTGMGVDLSKIKVDTDRRGYPRIRFSWAYQGEAPQEYAVSFLDYLGFETNEYIQEGYDLYYQKAGEDMALGYDQAKSFIGTFYNKHLKPGAFLVTDDVAFDHEERIFSNQADKFPISLKLIPFQGAGDAGKAIIALRESEGKNKGGLVPGKDALGYGWRMNIRQKPAASSAVKQDKSVLAETGGIDLANIELTLKENKFSSSFNPADYKILLAAKALKQGLGPLSLLRAYEASELLNVGIVKSIRNKPLFTQVLSEFGDYDFSGAGIKKLN